MQHLDLIGFLSLGFFGGFGHCIGMCHPFVLYISGRFTKGELGYINLLKPHFSYNIGRILTYSILGLLAGFLGDIAEMAGGMLGIQKSASVIAGIFLILYALLSFGGYNLLNKFENKVAADKVMGIIKRVQPKRSFTTGMLLGLLPCGLLYSALIAATSLGSMYKAGVAMALFGFGTMIALMITAVFGNYFMSRRGIFNILGLILLLIMGAYFVWSGIRY